MLSDAMCGWALLVIVCAVIGLVVAAYDHVLSQRW